MEVGSRRVRFQMALSVGLLLSLVGCGGEPVHHVSGEVVLRDGRPLAGGQIEFRAREMPISAVGYLDDNGRFELTLHEANAGTLAGEYQVALVPPSPPPGMPGNAEQERPLAERRREWLNLVPRHYQSADTSGIELTVTDDPSENQFQIVIDPLPASPQ